MQQLLSFQKNFALRKNAAQIKQKLIFTLLKGIRKNALKHLLKPSAKNAVLF